MGKGNNMNIEAEENEEKNEEIINQKEIEEATGNSIKIGKIEGEAKIHPEIIKRIGNEEKN